MRLSNWPRNWVPATSAVRVEQVDFFVPQLERHLAGDDLLRQALGDGRLADARLTDEAGVVLLTAVVRICTTRSVSTSRPTILSSSPSRAYGPSDSGSRCRGIFAFLSRRGRRRLVRSPSSSAPSRWGIFVPLAEEAVEIREVAVQSAVRSHPHRPSRTGPAGRRRSSYPSSHR